MDERIQKIAYALYQQDPFVMQNGDNVLTVEHHGYFDHTIIDVTYNRSKVTFVFCEDRYISGIGVLDLAVSDKESKQWELHLTNQDWDRIFELLIIKRLEQ